MANKHWMLSELNEAYLLEKILTKEYEHLRKGRFCVRTMKALERAIELSTTIVAQYKRRYYGDNSSHCPDEDGYFR